MARREEQKAVARAQREAAEREAQAQAERKRRMTILGSVLAVAAVAVVAAVLLSTSGSKKSTASPLPKDGSGSAKVPHAAEVAARFKGIPQSGVTLGSPKAPVTLTEFADLKCPICRDFTLGAFPALVQNYVRTGKLRVVLKLQTFVGAGAPQDTGRAARFALAAGKQNKLWQFADLFYLNQQPETDVYVTDTFLKTLGQNVPGLNVAQARKQAGNPAFNTELQQDATAFQAAGFTGTPSFTLGQSGQPGAPLSPSSLADPSQFTGPIDNLLKK